MGLGSAIQVVEVLGKLKEGDYLRVHRINALSIKALALAWYDEELSVDDIRDTLAAACLETKRNPYGYEVSEISAALEPGGILQRVAARAKEVPQWH